ncbi:MAG: SDR family NAD(P)-dependent oxidoreductase [Rhodothermales bacterium]|nr:SDR family NAD(P)-dependent oxidoreductase [Rhodothermales bacterium]
MYTLKNRIVFLTGASSGIGRACARQFSAAGARCILTARRGGRLDALAAELEAEFGAESHVVEMDVTDENAVSEAVAGLPEAWREIDVLLNNAGKALGLAPSYEITSEHLHGMFDTNVKGVLYLTRAVVPGMIARNRGHVIHIGSTAGKWVYPGGTVYCASKHAVKALNEGLKIDLHGTNVRVSTVDPGLVETEFSIVRFEGDAERADAVYAHMTPLRPDDVADAVLYCATRPAHVNISEILLMCVDQSNATLVHRSERTS